MMQGPSRNTRALLIGINSYPNLLPNDSLRGCINDVDLMHQLLLRRFGFPADNIRRLCNEQATRDGILKAFEDLVEAVGMNDVVVVYFAGHGSYVRVDDATKKASGFMETIVPYDSGRKSTGHRSTDIADIMIEGNLVGPLNYRTPFVTLFFDSCHSGSILRDDFGAGAVRGIDPDGDIRETDEINDVKISGWLPTQSYRSGDPSWRYVLLASCRANEKAYEMPTEKPHGVFTYELCKVINESRNEDMRTLFRLASAKVTARYQFQHPILEGPQDALVFGTYRLETPRYLAIKRVKIDGRTTLVDMDGGLASGVTYGSIWAIRPLENSPQNSDVQIKVMEVSAFVSRAVVIQQGPRIDNTCGCFEVSHEYGGPILNILVDSQRDPEIKELTSQVGASDSSGILNIVKNAEEADVEVCVRPNTMGHTTWVALARDGQVILPPTTRLSDFGKNLRKLAWYQFGLSLRNMDEHNELRGKLNLQLRRRPKARPNDPWQNAQMGVDGFPHFEEGDHIACIIKNNSEFDVWPYILEFAEDGSVNQCYPFSGGEELLAKGRVTKEVAKMQLHISSDSEQAFQLAADKSVGERDGRSGPEQRNGRRPRKRVTEVLKLFASTMRIDLSLLLQTPVVRTEGVRGLSSLLRLDARQDVCAWWTVEEPFVLESNEMY